MEPARPHAYDDDRLREDIARIDRNFAELDRPDGMVRDWPGPSDSVPAGFVVLDGQALSRRDHPVLFALYGVRFGRGDGMTTFRVPVVAGRENGTAVTKAG